MTKDSADWDLPEEEEQLPPSRSQQKRDAQALKAVGDKLVSMSRDQLKKLDLPVELADAVAEAQRIHARSGRKRQLQYIGKIMRNVDAAPIVAALARLEQTHQADNQVFHKMETWRDRLLSEGGDGVLTEFMQQFPDVDRQHFRQLVRQARNEKGEQKRNTRLLFKEIRRLMEAANDTGPNHEGE